MRFTMYTIIKTDIRKKVGAENPVGTFLQRYVAVQVTDYLNLKEQNRSIYYRMQRQP